MAWSHVADYGNNNKTSGQAVSASVTANVGDILLVIVSADQVLGTTIIGSDSVTDASSNTYTRIGIQDEAASTGSRISAGLYITTVTTALSSQNVTYTPPTSITAKSIIVARFTGGSSTLRGSTQTVTSGSTSTTTFTVTSDTSTTAQSGDLVFAWAAAERPSDDTYTDDSDTTNGSWSTTIKNGTTGGSTSSNATAFGGYKIVTGSGSQTWNSGHGNGRNAGGITVLEAGAAGTPKSDSDTSSGAEGTPSIGSSQSDTSSTTETVSSSATFSQSDVSNSTETQTVSTASSDTASGTEGAVVVGISSSDTGTGLDSESISASFSVSDTANSTETQETSASLSGSDTSTGTETQSAEESGGNQNLSGSDTANGTETQSIALSGSDTSTSTETHSISVTFSSSDTGSSSESQSTSASLSFGDTGSGTETQTSSASLTSTDSGSGSESTSIVASFNSSDTGNSSESQSTTQVSNWSPAVSGTTLGSGQLGDFATTLILGPAEIYIADYGTPEPTDLSTLSGSWTSLGGTFDGVNLTVKHKWQTVQFKQLPDKPYSRVKKRQLIVDTFLAEPTLTALLFALNHGSLVSGSGYTSYSPPAIDRATPVTYRTIVIEGWAPGFNSNQRHKRRRIVLRKCISFQGAAKSNYGKKKQTTFQVKWDVHNIDSSTAPFKIIDET